MGRAAERFLTTLPGAARQTYPEDDFFWTVYVAGVYEIDVVRPDNDPNSEVAWLGQTDWQEPEYGIIPMEIIRDVAAQRRGGQPQWNAQQTAAFQRIVALHEIGHQFELIDDKDGFLQHQHVMEIHRNDAEEAQLPQTPTTFREQDIVRIRQHGSGDPPFLHP